MINGIQKDFVLYLNSLPMYLVQKKLYNTVAPKAFKAIVKNLKSIET